MSSAADKSCFTPVICVCVYVYISVAGWLRWQRAAPDRAERSQHSEHRWNWGSYLDTHTHTQKQKLTGFSLYSLIFLLRKFTWTLLVWSAFSHSKAQKRLFLSMNSLFKWYNYGVVLFYTVPFELDTTEGTCWHLNSQNNNIFYIFKCSDIECKYETHSGQFLKSSLDLINCTSESLFNHLPKCGLWFYPNLLLSHCLV